MARLEDEITIPLEDKIPEPPPYEPSSGEITPMLTNLRSVARQAKSEGRELQYIPGRGTYETEAERDMAIESAQKEFGEESVYDLGEVRKKPSEEELDISQKVAGFKDHLIKTRFGGRDPFTFDYESDERNRVMQNIQNSDRSLMTPQKKMEIDKAILTNANANRNRDRTALQQGLQFAEQQAMTDMRQAKTQKAIDERARLTRESLDERAKITQAEKLQEADKQELTRVRKEMTDLKKSIRETEGKGPLLNTEMYADLRNKLPLWKQELSDLQGEEKAIIDKYKKETPKEGKAKTVTIDGKQYKDGDVVTRNGKKYRVRVKE